MSKISEINKDIKNLLDKHGNIKLLKVIDKYTIKMNQAQSPDQYAKYLNIIKDLKDEL